MSGQTEQARKNLKRLQRVKTWQLVIILVIACLASATFLRLNNVGMVERRTAVLRADETGESIVIQERLYELQVYVSRHMNTSTGPLYLQHQYNRDVEALIDGSSDETRNINREVEEICKQRHSSYSQAWVQCFADELSRYPAGEDPLDASSLPEPALYRHDFRAPLWSPDFAGFSVLFAAIVAFTIIARLIGVAVLHLLLKYRYKSI